MVNNFDVADFAKEFNSSCSKTQIKEFNKGETITTYLVNRNQLCILISGTADLVRYKWEQSCNRTFFKRCYIRGNIL